MPFHSPIGSQGGETLKNIAGVAYIILVGIFLTRVLSRRAKRAREEVRGVWFEERTAAATSTPFQRTYECIAYELNSDPVPICLPASPPPFHVDLFAFFSVAGLAPRQGKLISILHARKSCSLFLNTDQPRWSCTAENSRAPAW